MMAEKPALFIKTADLADSGALLSTPCAATTH